MDKEVKQEPASKLEGAASENAVKKTTKPKQRIKNKRKLKVKPAPKKRTRTVRPYPTAPLEEVLQLADQIQTVAAGERVRRLTLLKAMNRSPTSSGIVTLITNSGKYGITTGSYAAEFLELTPDGRIATAPDSLNDDRLNARFRLGIESVAPFKILYDEYRGKRLPDHEVMKDLLLAKAPDVSDPKEVIDTFIVNANTSGCCKLLAATKQ